MEIAAVYYKVSKFMRYREPLSLLTVIKIHTDIEVTILVND